MTNLREEVALAICAAVDEPSCYFNDADIVRCFGPHADAAITVIEQERGRLREVVCAWRAEEAEGIDVIEAACRFVEALTPTLPSASDHAASA